MSDRRWRELFLGQQREKLGYLLVGHSGPASRMRIANRTLSERFPNLRQVGTPVSLQTEAVRGFSSFPVAFCAQRGRS